MYAYFEYAWCCLGFLVVVFCVVILGLAIFADHTPNGYYIAPTLNGNICVNVDYSWDSDVIVFCSPDPAKAIEFTNLANQANKIRKGGK